MLEGDGEGSIKKTVAEGIAEVVANAPEDLNTLKEVADYIASDKTKASEIEKAISNLGVKDTQLENSINANATAILSKQPLLTGDEFKTINAQSIMGKGNIELPKVEIVNDLTTGGADKALSAEMGKVLKEMIPTDYITEIPDTLADKTYVDNAVLDKADKSYVDNAISMNITNTLNTEV